MERRKKKTTDLLQSHAEQAYKSLTAFLLIAVFISALSYPHTMLINSPYLSLLYWGVLIMAIFFLFPGIAATAKIRHQPLVKSYAVSGAIAYVAILFLVGVLLKQLKASPYDLSLFGIFHNLAIAFPAVIAKEMIRAYSIGTIWKYTVHRRFHLIILTVFFALIELKPLPLSQLQNLEKVVIFLSSELGVTFALSTLATVLIFYGNASSGILFFLILEGFLKLFPFVPELPWLATAAIGIVFPVVFSMFIMDSCKNELENKGAKNTGGDVSYLIALFLSVLFSWFCVGVFSVYPSIILTGSMEPQIKPGDMVIIQKMKTEEDINHLKEGDIINYKRQNITITHRIQKVNIDKAGNRSFITKGDNNSSADDIEVLPNDIKGIIIGNIPKIGFPILLIKSTDQIPEGVIDNGTSNQNQASKESNP